MVEHPDYKMKSNIQIFFFVLLCFNTIDCTRGVEYQPDVLKLFESMEQQIKDEYVLKPESNNSSQSSTFLKNYKSALITVSREVFSGSQLHYKNMLIKKLDALKNQNKIKKTRLAMNAFLSVLPLGNSNIVYQLKTEKLEEYGIGAVIKKKGNRFIIVDVLEGSGSFRANLIPGKEIKTIQGKDLLQNDLVTVVSRIRGREHSFVKLGFANGQAVEVERGQINFIPIQHSQWVFQGGRRILYIMPRTTHLEVTGRIRNLLKRKNHYQIIVLDLRKLFNGSIKSAFAMADLFINEKISIQIKSRTTTVGSFKSDPQIITSNPIYVIYNKESSGIARLLAFLLKTRNNVKLIGVPALIDIFFNNQKQLDDYMTLNLTTGILYINNTTPLHNHQLLPDITIDSDFPHNPPLNAPDPEDLPQMYLAKKYKIQTN